MGRQAARCPVRLDFLEVDEAHQMQGRSGIARGEGAGHDLQSAGRADGIEQGCGLGLPGGSPAGKWNNGRKRRNAI